eukprot:Amastigsp_a679247_6.p3 type:complete len:100 gc:universal Amastigsp_a679247_6:609-310(-)
MLSSCSSLLPGSMSTLRQLTARRLLASLPRLVTLLLSRCWDERLGRASTTTLSVWSSDIGTRPRSLFFSPSTSTSTGGLGERPRSQTPSCSSASCSRVG